jgi:hypothetical protein
MDWNLDWNKTIVDNLTPAMLAWKNDFFGLPPQGSDEEKIFYWVNFIKAIVQNESGNNPKCDYQEDETVDNNISRGLLQLSTEDAQNEIYADCPTVVSLTLENIYDPATNLKAGMEIMNHLIENGETSLRAYWSTTNEEEKGAQTLETLRDLNGALND